MTSVQTWFHDHGITIEPKTFTTSTHTAAQAAEQLNCNIAQIAKSILFLTDKNYPLLIIACGGQRIDETKLSHTVGSPLRKANANEVKNITGYEIGGVPPVAHQTPIAIYFDPQLLKYDSVWASAGTANSVFAIDPHQLLKSTQAKLI